MEFVSKLSRYGWVEVRSVRDPIIHCQARFGERPSVVCVCALYLRSPFIASFGGLLMSSESHSKTSLIFLKLLRIIMRADVIWTQGQHAAERL